VARTGSTDGWTGFGSFPGSAITSGPYTPGDKSTYARFQILPSNALDVLPPQILLLISWSFSPEVDTATYVIDDLVSIGDVSGFITSNVALNSPLSGSTQYRLDTTGLTLASLNAGSYYLYLGASAFPSSYSTGSVTFSYSGTGTHDKNGVTTAWSGSPPFSTDTGNGTALPCYADENGTLTVTATGPGSFVIADVTVESIATGAAVDLVPPSTTCTALGSNGYGGNELFTGPSAQGSDLSTTRRVRINYSGGSGSTSVTAHSRGASTVGASTGRDTAKVTISATAVSPDSVTASISILLLSYPDMGSGTTLTGNAMTGAVAILDEQEMTTINLGDTLTFWAQLTRYSTGAAYDATGSVTFRIYEETTDTPLLSGTLAVQDDPNTTGFYRGQASITVDNGFEVGKCYCVRVGATVDTIAQAGVVERFVVRSAFPSVSSIAAAVWSALDPGDTAGRASSLGGMLRQVWSYCFNRNSIQGSLQAVYRDDSSSVMLQGAQSASDTTADRGRMA